MTINIFVTSLPYKVKITQGSRWIHKFLYTMIITMYDNNDTIVLPRGKYITSKELMGSSPVDVDINTTSPYTFINDMDISYTNNSFIVSSSEEDGISIWEYMTNPSIKYGDMFDADNVEVLTECSDKTCKGNYVSLQNCDINVDYSDGEVTYKVGNDNLNSILVTLNPDNEMANFSYCGMEVNSDSRLTKISKALAFMITFLMISSCVNALFKLTCARELP